MEILVFLILANSVKKLYKNIRGRGNSWRGSSPLGKGQKCTWSFAKSVRIKSMSELIYI